MGTMKDLEIEKAVLRTIEINDRFDELACQIFLQSPGKEFLQLLKEKYLYAIVANPNVNAAVAYYREGENSLIRKIVQALSKYKEQSFTVPVEETNEKTKE